MALTNIDHFSRKDCEKIDANCVNAFVDFHLDPENPTGLCLDTSWGGGCLDLTSIVKAAETCTSLYLSPQPNPNCLVYEGECENFCITGDELSRIISMHLLKDVDQTTPPRNGDIYIYRDGLFYTFNLQDFIDDVNNALSLIRAQITNLTNRVNNHETRITKIENDIAPILEHWELPAGLPEGSKIMLGNINLYSDCNAAINSSGAATSLDRTHGIYGHSLYVDKTYDEIFG